MNFDFERIEVLDFLEELGIQNVQDKGDEVFYSCPFPGHSNGDSNPSASMKQGSTTAYCFGCGWRGNALRFLSDYEGVSPVLALKWLRERFGDDFKEPDGSVLAEIDSILFKEDKENVPLNAWLDEKEQSKREVDWIGVFCEWEQTYDSPWPLSYMFDREFSPEALGNYEIGWDRISQRITIPYRTAEGKLLGFKARAVEEDQFPRYLVLGGDEYGFPPMHVGSTLFGIQQAINSKPFENKKHLYVREGELNAISMADRGYTNTVGISGKFLSNQQSQLLRNHCTHATFWFDDLEDSYRAAKKLEPYISVGIITYTDSDPAEMDANLLDMAIMDYWATPLMLSLTGIE